MLNFPLIISNGGSRSNPEWYSQHLNLPEDQLTLYPELIAKHFGGFCMNVSVAGSNNRRIIRRTLYECIKQLETNPTQKTIVLLEIILDLRKEIWVESEESEHNDLPAESNFYGITIADELDWWQKMLVGKQKNIGVDAIKGKTLNPMQQKYVEKWQHGQQFFYSPVAENINLCADLIMLTGFLKHHNIDYLIFRSQPVETEINDHLLETFSDLLKQDSNILDLFEFSFTQWCLDHNYKPIDFQDRPLLGHPSLEAHRAFALFLLEKLKKS